jgi:hypothetical protein
MMDLFLGGIAAWFTIPAVVGTLYFMLQFLMQGIGGDLDLDVDADGGFDTTGIGHEVGHDFKVLSLQTLSAFFMGGGWMGWAAYRLLELSPFMSSIVAVVAGVSVGWMLVALMRAVLRLQGSGNIGLGDAVGLEGEVYIEVPADGAGAGRVKLVVQQRLREFDAVQGGGEPITTGTRVRVARANTGSNTLLVERV